MTRLELSPLLAFVRATLSGHFKRTGHMGRKLTCRRLGVPLPAAGFRSLRIPEFGSPSASRCDKRARWRASRSAVGLRNGGVLVLVAVPVPVAPGCRTTSCTPAPAPAPVLLGIAQCPTGCGPAGTAATYVLDLDTTLWRPRAGPWYDAAGWNAATPPGEPALRQAGVPNGLPDLPASSGALIRTDAADSLSR